MKNQLALILIVTTSISMGCATVASKHRVPSEADPTNTMEETANNDPSEAGETEPPAPKEPTVSSLTLDSNAKVEAWIQYFAKKDQARFQRFLDRGQKYRKIVENVLIENDLPPELYFLALIESGYQTHATSTARAVGVWQFMPATARRYGLEINRYLDERRDPIRATEAAAKYLRDLYNIFGSWPLAMAAYNAGEYRVIRSILKGKSRDFWTLASMGMLPSETADYVPKLMAAATIGAEPEKYGFTQAPGETFPELEAIEVPTHLRLTDLARSSELELEKLREYNPHLSGPSLPAHVSHYETWFPKENAAKLQPRIAELAKNSPRSTPNPTRAVARSQKAPDTKHHRVKAGENLTLIAKRYGTSVNYLLKVNSLRSPGKIYPGMNLRITSKTYSPRAITRHRVQKGESLDRIARRFGISVNQLKEDNSLDQNRIYPGQVLMIKKERS